MIPTVTLTARYSSKLAAYRALSMFKGNGTVDVKQDGDEWVLTIETKTNGKTNTRRNRRVV